MTCRWPSAVILACAVLCAVPTRAGPVAQAEATCVVFSDDMSPQDDASEEIDDLFVELIDD